MPRANQGRRQVAREHRGQQGPGDDERHEREPCSLSVELSSGNPWFFSRRKRVTCFCDSGLPASKTNFRTVVVTSAL